MRHRRRSRKSPHLKLRTLRQLLKLKRHSVIIFGLVVLNHQKMTMRSSQLLLATCLTLIPLQKPSLGTSQLDDSQKKFVPVGRQLPLHKQLEARKEAESKLTMARKEVKRVVKKLPSQQQQMRTILIHSQKMLRLIKPPLQLSRRSKKRQNPNRKNKHQLPSPSSFGMSSRGVQRLT